MDELIVQGEIHERIYMIRGKQVMIDRDLAAFYMVETRALKQSVRRNIKRFPADFMFELSEKEIDALVSQSVIPSKKYFGGAKPFAFTEQGVNMLSAILKSDRAIDISIAIMRTFSKLREFSSHYNALAKKIMEVERKSDKQYKKLTKALEDLINESKIVESKTIGFIKSEKE
jgi:hypothetical protein